VRDEEFENTMDTWADHETESAPGMHPTAEMYRMVQAKRKKSLLFVLLSRRAILGTAVASLMVLAILYTGLFDPSTLFNPPPAQQVTVVAMREGFAAEKGGMVIRTVVPSHRGLKKGLLFFQQLLFQFQKQDSRSVVGVDPRGPHEEAITLTAADNYRLFLEPAHECYVYVFQLTSADALAKLFPNETYTSVKNPLRQGQTYYLPSKPNWFYLGESKGQERLYVIA